MRPEGGVGEEGRKDESSDIEVNTISEGCTIFGEYDF
jgi:hypothetical protein